LYILSSGDVLEVEVGDVRGSHNQDDKIAPLTALVGFSSLFEVYSTLISEAVLLIVDMPIAVP